MSNSKTSTKQIKGLIIVESPAKAKTIGKFLDNQYKILASMGHVRDLPKKVLGVDLENDFKPKYVVARDKMATIKLLKEAAVEAPEILIASDHDREGEAIAWHLAELLKKEIKGKPVHRIIFNEITKSAIVKAIKNPGEIDTNKVNAQQARRILDRIVGYIVSPVLWKVITKSLSAGRVQSVALRMVCERNAEIVNFVQDEYWSIETNFQKDKLAAFSSQLHSVGGKKIKITSKDETDELIASLTARKYEIANIETKQRNIQPYPPYITSTLQQDASKLLYYSPKRTMQIAQQLYEGVDIGGETLGLITYMRTDSLRIADEAIKSLRSYITSAHGKQNLHKTVRHYKAKSSAQDAHEAIRPTSVTNSPGNVEPYLTKDQLKLYRIIWQRFVATQMSPITTENLSVEIMAGDALFKSTGISIIKEGFLIAYPYVKISQGIMIDVGYQVADQLKYDKLNGLQHFTKPPARFSEASLIKELESKGIGRPSTYATITNTIIERKYVELEEKKFVPTHLGLSVNTFLTGHFSELFNTEFTAQMEQELDKIEYENLKWQDIIKDHHDIIKELLSKIDIKKSKAELIEPTTLKCEKCESPMVIKWGKIGQFLACSNFPECSNIMNFTRTKDGDVLPVVPDELEEKCPDCGHNLLVKTGRFGKFIACSDYPNCKFTKPMGIGVKCPDCADGEVVQKRSKKGKTFYGCSKYPDCKFVTYYMPVAIECPACKNYYMEERISKQKENYKKCPKCGEEVK